MFVIGVDPGLSRCGYGGVRSPARAELAGVITTPTSAPVHERLALLGAELEALLASHRPDVVVVERVFFQTNARTAIPVAQASGVALATAAAAGCEVAQYTSNEVKLAVAGYGGASKDQMQRVVASQLGLAEPPRPPDVADALALAVCHLTVAPRLQRWAAAR